MARWQTNDIFVASISHKVGLVFDCKCEIVFAEHVSLRYDHVFVNKLGKAVEIPFAVCLDDGRPHLLDLFGSEIAVEDRLGIIEQVY